MTLPESNPWTGKTILSLDGGGIRGLATLYLLRGLLFELEEAEHKQSVCECGAGAYNCERSWRPEGTDEIELWHYFDYICGTSTGGLMAIAIGRVRVNLDQVSGLFDAIGNEIFAKPRFPFLTHRAKWLVHRYDGEGMKRAIEDALLERSGHQKLLKNEPRLHNSNIANVGHVVRRFGSDPSN